MIPFACCVKRGKPCFVWSFGLYLAPEPAFLRSSMDANSEAIKWRGRFLSAFFRNSVNEVAVKSGSQKRSVSLERHRSQGLLGTRPWVAGDGPQAGKETDWRGATGLWDSSGKNEIPQCTTCVIHRFYLEQEARCAGAGRKREKGGSGWFKLCWFSISQWWKQLPTSPDLNRLLKITYLSFWDALRNESFSYVISLKQSACLIYLGMYKQRQTRRPESPCSFQRETYFS